MKRTAEDLKILQALPLEVKIRKTELRIEEWYKKFDGQVYVSFSGGKDSTVLLDIVRRMYPNIPAVYIDTGLEYPEVKQFVKTQENVTKIKPKMNFKEVVQKYGYPVISKEQSAFIYECRHTKSPKLKDIRLNGNKWGRGKISKKWLFMLDAPFEVGDQCCDKLKKDPAKAYEKKTGRHPIVAVMADESAQRKSNWLKYGCNAFDSKRPQSKPMSFWTEQDVLKYIKDNQLEYASVYGEILQDKNGKYFTTGCDRTGCVFCGFGCQKDKTPNRYQRLKVTHPKLYDYCMRPIEDKGLGMKEVLEYMNIPIE